MSKLEIEFELTGLKLKIKGDSDEASGKVADLQRQIQGLMNTIGTLTQGAANPALPPAPPAQNGLANPATKLIEVQAEPVAQNGRKGGHRGGARRSGGTRQRAEAVEFKHDAEKYGFPKQEWNTAQKAMWLLYMLSHETGQHEYPASVVAASFNKHFKSFGAILTANVLRDLAKEKGKSGWINSDASQEPQMWYLLEEGKKGIAALIVEGKKPAA